MSKIWAGIAWYVACNTDIIFDTVTVSTAVAGALGYNIYVGTATGAANLKYQGTLRGTGTFTIQGASATGLTGNNAAFTTTGAAASRASADTSAYATGYDGILPTVLGTNSGYNNSINSTFSTSNPGNEYQVVFYNLYGMIRLGVVQLYIADIG